MRSSQTSAGSPMDTQTSVYITSAFFTASSGLSQNFISAPVCAAISMQVSISALSGKYFFGAQAVKFIPIFAQPTMSELPMLYLASPM